MKKLLFISPWFPYPADNGSKLRVYNLARQLARQYEVFLVGFARERGDAAPQAIDHLRTFCKFVGSAQLPVYSPTFSQKIRGLFSNIPSHYLYTHSSGMSAGIERLERQFHFDVVIASQLTCAPYALEVPAKTRFFEEIELSVYTDVLRAKPNLPGRLRFWLTRQKYNAYVASLARQFDGCTVASQREKDELQQLAPSLRNVAVIPNGVDAARYSDGFSGAYGAPQPDTLVYSGALSFFANLEAVAYFLDEIFPLVLQKRPQTKLLVTGKLDGVPLDRLPLDRPGVRDAVQFTGYLEDVRPTIAASWASIAPIRAGGGTRLKILEALALGTPVVSTSKGAEGLDLAAGQDLLIADEPGAFAGCLLELLDNPQLRQKLAARGHETVNNRYNWGIIGENLLDFLSTVSGGTRQ